jgi:hypothetical protein
MIVTHPEPNTRNRARLDGATYAGHARETLPPARIALVPFSLDEVEAQPEDIVRPSLRRTPEATCSCSRAILADS